MSIKSCEHTFCSECIRTHINQSGNTGSFCPKCRQSKAYDSELVPQPILETTALEWVKARAFLVRLQQREIEQIALKPTRQASGHASSSNLASPIVNGRRAQLEEDVTPPRRSKRIKTEAQPRAGRAAGSRSSPLLLDDEEEDAARLVSGDDDDYIVAMDDRDGDYADHNPNKTPIADNDQQRQLKPSDTVACPICSHDFTMTALNRHLDTDKCFPGCPPPAPEQQGFATLVTASSAPSGNAKPKAGSSWFTTSAPSTTPAALANGKRRGRPQYNLKTERELRALLSDAELPTSGDRDAMINRHRQWINIWNANLDSTKARKSAVQLRKELAQWEKTRTGAKDHAAVVERQKSSWTVSFVAVGCRHKLALTLSCLRRRALTSRNLTS